MFDSKTYDALAQNIIDNGIFSIGPSVIGPLYAYFLVFTYTLVGDSFSNVMVLQAIIGALTCVVTAYTGRIIFNQKVGFIAGLLSTVYGPLVFYSATYLTESILGFVNICLALSLTKAYLEDKSEFWIVSGLLLGLSCLGKPNMILLLPVLLLFNYIRPPGSNWLASSLRLLIGALLIITPVTVNNIYHGSYTLISSNAGYNFYIGNNMNATGLFIPINELNPSSSRSVFIPSNVVQPETDGKLSSFQADIIWFGKSWEYISRDPTRYILLLFKKTMFYLNSYEVPQIYNYNYLSRQGIIRYLIPSLAIIGPLGLLGIIVNIWNVKARPAILLYCTYGISIILFFITARFRIPVIPILIIFSSDALIHLFETFKDDVSRLKGKLAILILAFFIVNNTVYESSDIEFSSMLNPYNNLGRSYEQDRLYDKAIESYEKAIELNPTHYEAYNNMGAAYNKLGDYKKAEEYLRKAINLNHNNEYAYNNLGNVLYATGRYNEAEKAYLSAISINKFFHEAHNNLGGVYMELDDLNKAITEFEIARELNPDDATIRYNLGIAYINSGKIEKGVDHLRLAASIDPSFKTDYNRALSLINS